MPETHEPIPVAGYQPQTDSNIAIVNGFKHREEEILRKLDELSTLGLADPRWLAIGRTQLEQAFMAINRSIFQPKRVKLEAGAEEPRG